MKDALKNCQFYINDYLRRHPSVRNAVEVLRTAQPNPATKPQEDKTNAEPRASDPATKAKVLEDLRAGKTNKQISLETGISPSTITKWRARAGIPGKVSWGRGLTLEQKRARARAAYWANRDERLASARRRAEARKLEQSKQTT